MEDQRLSLNEISEYLDIGVTREDMHIRLDTICPTAMITVREK